jgi:hypothetical protein
VAQTKAANRHPVDASEIVRLGVQDPHARALLEEGEASLGQDPKRAADRFGQAAAEATYSALAPRRQCQALLELGDRNAALNACRTAMNRGGSPLDIRALVRAILSKPGQPNFEELYETTLLAARAQRAMPHQPWGYAAQCDIARRLGDSKMLEECRKNLKRVAPDHAETRRASAGVVSRSMPARMAAGWGAIALVLLATLIDFARRAGRRNQVARPPLQPGVEV